MTSRPLSLMVVFGAAALVLGGCKSDKISDTRHLQPIPSKTVALMKQKGMTKEDPILVRIYKEDSELELWKKDNSGRFALLKTYEICRFSGDLGPKKVEGDGQSPEGFYSVTPGQMNPRSSYYLSFNLGYPNAFDRSLGRTGAHLMVHGDCLSKGCYAMTDEQIAEVYAIAREALEAGQPSFQVQAFPFRMTAENMARRRDNKNFAFWKNLKEGADHFELTKLAPNVDVCGQKYVFDAEPTNGGRFDPNAQCPSYEVNPAIAMAMAGKKKRDGEKFEDLVSGGLQVAEAYVPQNGRVRRDLDEPIRKSVPAAPVMTARAEPPAPASSGYALAMADTGGAVPMPVPSPYASEQPKNNGASGGMFAWLRSDKPAELDTPQTPNASSSETPGAKSGTTVAMAGPRTVAPNRPIAASLAPVEKEKPFYKRLFSFGGKDDDEKDKAAAPAPKPEPKAAAAPPMPVPAPQPAPEPQPKQSSRAGAAHDAFGATAILNSGGFQ